MKFLVPSHSEKFARANGPLASITWLVSALISLADHQRDYVTILLYFNLFYFGIT